MNDYKCVTTIQGILDYLGDAKVVAFDYETAPDEDYRDWSAIIKVESQNSPNL